jgi:hypothetical protein
MCIDASPSGRRRGASPVDPPEVWGQCLSTAASLPGEVQISTVYFSSGQGQRSAFRKGQAKILVGGTFEMQPFLILQPDGDRYDDEISLVARRIKGIQVSYIEGDAQPSFAENCICIQQEDADAWGSTPAVCLAFPNHEALQKWCNCLCFAGCIMHDMSDHAVVAADLPKVRLVRPKSERMGTGVELRALKVATQPSKQKQLVNDVYFLLKLSHPGILRCYGAYNLRANGESGLGMLMDFKSGSDLASWIPDHGLQEWAIKGIVENIRDALLYLHGLGIVHRDIKPTNVVLDRGEDGYMRACLADFGFAAYAADWNAISQRCGSPGYIAPEIFEKKWTVSSAAPEDTHVANVLKTDIFSFGMLIYATAIGVNPLVGWTVTSTSQNNARGLKIGEEVSCLSDELQDLLKKFTTRYPEERCSIFDSVDHPWFTKDIRTLGFAGGANDLSGNFVSWEAFQEASRRHH